MIFCHQETIFQIQIILAAKALHVKVKVLKDTETEHLLMVQFKTHIEISNYVIKCIVVHSAAINIAK